MHRLRTKLLVVFLVIGILSWLGLINTVKSFAYAQQPTVAIPTVTSSPFGPMVTVNSDQEQINVRAGPSAGGEYPIVGVLQQGETVPAIGRSPGGDWIQIVYPTVNGGVAWVYAYLVTVSGGELPIVEPPPTPTPKVTPTIDPTLASQFNLGAGLATRLPTYTPAPAAVYPTFEPGDASRNGIPPILPIAGLMIIGAFGLLVSVLRGR